ncbi:MAG TPA: AIPR family protein, partial [Candidatus Obscuribacterales bacterium]
MQQDKVLLRFLEEINDDVLRACEENDESDAERFFTDWMLEFWTDTGLIEEGAAVCNYDTRKFKVNGYKPSTDEDSVDLFVSHLVQQTEIQTLTKAQVNSLFTRARDFFEESAATSKRFFERMDGPPEAAAIAEDIFTRRRKIDRVRFLLFTNAVSISTVKDEEQVGNRTFSYEILDLERTLQEHLSRQPITIDFRSEFGESIPCLKAPNMEADYTSCLAMFRGEILYKIYKRYGARLLERNVRSFLQARPKVNKGIRETIVKMPDRFLAYNNGISATAAHIDFYDAPGGSCVINRITDLQIVNGGQTTAMIYQTHKIAPEHVSKIYVPAKITMVKDPALLDSIVPEIARCANSQNKISDSDFLANDAFHTTLQDLSRLTAAKLPGSSQVF